uniref:Macro domain-containing protein n=1 Tax=Chromera velia CCMP2878 TaxID=1169474 RepID=A0A0G4HQH9_9ALVE|eukprot:Cvel_30307.t1-p1 / transcript=Cvel_30307.t1 / gene=Cvel_30307 / organism=Chromera_velia_CCMP2878 / gene_product=hypothetical protein / transcript_product=hypothetical protein / location=Cvel_scaffold4300:4156-6257(-) / protein_length=458 / sequence_SO=supercontig / SO=protein_coding / is_pseudo=false
MLTVRWGSYLEKKSNLARQRALEAHQEYLRSLKKPPIYNTTDPLLNRKTRRATHWFKHVTDPQSCDNVIREGVSVDQTVTQEEQEEWLEAQFKPVQYEGVLLSKEFPHFGTLSVIHGDVLKEGAGEGKSETGSEVEDCVLIPMTANFSPPQGLGLRFLELGGRNLIHAAFEEVRQLVASKSEEGQGGVGGLTVGDVILTRTFGAAKAKRVAFVVLPYFFQGGSFVASQRLRSAVRAALQKVNEEGVSRVVMPALGTGVLGFSPTDIASILVQESIEVLLQVDTTTPTYSLKEIDFMDTDRGGAEALKTALVEAGERWLPEEQTIPAPVYFSKETARVLHVSPWLMRRPLRRSRYAFAHRHGIIRNRPQWYLRNVRPFLWRPARLLEPPPLLLRKKTGEPVSPVGERARRPFYHKDVTHVLFPPPRVDSGFPSFRLNRRGQWVGKIWNPKIHAETKPKQ